jgi:hypothetical protein
LFRIVLDEGVKWMKKYRLLQFLALTLLLVQPFEIIPRAPYVAVANQVDASSEQYGLIRVALTENVAPRSDWSNGTLYSLRILQKFLPINITVITDFTSLSDYQVLFLNMLNISDADITAVTNWVYNGGSLVCIGQSGRYNEAGVERASHPLATVLGLVLDGWERTSGAEVRKIVTKVDWYWWTSGVVYDTANNGDGLYWELEDYYYIPQSETANVSLNGATLKMSCRDKDDAYEEPFLTSNTYGSGNAFFIAADAFYRLMWKPPKEEVGLYNNENYLVAGYWFRSGLLWQILYAIVLDCFSNVPLPIITSMPNGYYSAMNFGLKVNVTDYAYEDLTQFWQPELFDKYPTLKGWFWGFWLVASGVDETYNATDLINFVKEYGYAGIRSETGALQDYLLSYDFLTGYGFDYKYDGSSGLYIGINDMINLIENWNFTNIFYLRRASGQLEHGAEISTIPTPICNDTGIINFYASPYIYPPDWSLLIQQQKILGENYGIGGLCTGNDYENWTGYIPDADKTISTFIDDNTLWTTNGSGFLDWWNKRWEVNMTGFSVNSTQMTIDLQTPNVQGLTVLLKGRDDISEITVDGAVLSPNPESNRLVIPELTEGMHRIVIKFMFNPVSMEEYNEELKVEGKPYVQHSTQIIEYINYTHQCLRLTLDLSGNVSAELKVNSSYVPRQVFADGQPINFTYDGNVATVLTSYAQVDIYYAQPKINRFSSSKTEYLTNESVTLTLETYADHSTSDVVKWLARVVVLDEALQIVDTMDQEIEMSAEVVKILDFTVKNLPQGSYTIIAEMLDPDAGNILAVNSLRVNVTETSAAPSFFGSDELEMYNDELRSEGLPYVEGSTQTIVDLVFSNSYQRLSITLDVLSGVKTGLNVYSSYSPRQVFADGQPISFSYSANITTMLVSYAHVDIYYAQPKIAEFTTSKPSYYPDEEVGLALKVYGDYSAPETVKWLIRLTIRNETEEIVKTMYEDIELNMTQTLTLQPAVGKLSEGIYTLTAETIDPDAENILETNSTTTTVAKAPTGLSLPLIVLIITVVAMGGTAAVLYVLHRLKVLRKITGPEFGHKSLTFCWYFASKMAYVQSRSRILISLQHPKFLYLC